MPIEQAPVNFTPMTELLAPPPAMVEPQHEENVTGSLEVFATGLGGIVPPEYGATVRVEFSNSVTAEVTARRTQPPLGEPFTSVDVKVKVPLF